MLEGAKLGEGAVGGTLQGVETGLEARQARSDAFESVGEGVAADALALLAGGVEDLGVADEPVLPELGFDEAETADEPLVVDDGVDEVALAGGRGAEMGVVLGGELGEGGGVFATDDEGFGMQAGLEGVHAGAGFAGLGAGAGGELGVAAIGGEWLWSRHKSKAGRMYAAPTGVVARGGDRV